MSLTRKFLKGLDIDEGKIELIIEEHTSVTDAQKAEIEKLKADSEKITALQKELDDANKKIKQSETDNYKEKYERIIAENQAKETAKRTDSAIAALLKDKGFSSKGVEMILKYGGYRDKVEIDSEGKIKKPDDFISLLGTDWDGYKELETVGGAETHNPPKEAGSDTSSGLAKRLSDAYMSAMYGTKKEG